jgi:hypothetical protein
MKTLNWGSMFYIPESPGNLQTGEENACFGLLFPDELTKYGLGSDEVHTLVNLVKNWRRRYKGERKLQPGSRVSAKILIRGWFRDKILT